LGNVVWLAIVACREQNETRNKRRVDRARLGISLVFGLGFGMVCLARFQSGSRSAGHLHMFPVTFDDYMIFLLFTRSWLQFLFCFRLPLVQRVRGNFSGVRTPLLLHLSQNCNRANALHKNKSAHRIEELGLAI